MPHEIENIKVNKNFEDEVLVFFADAVKVLGIPKSVGEIYGLLFVCKEPMSLDCLVDRLGVSKGSVSQGLKMLRTLGAIKEAGSTGRKIFYEADVDLKSLVGGFIREEIRPHLKSAKEKISRLEEKNVNDDPFYGERVDKLNNWRKRAGLVLPMIQKILGS